MKKGISLYVEQKRSKEECNYFAKCCKKTYFAK